MTNCEIILKQTGPLMSGELGAILVSQYGLIANTASKVVRAKMPQTILFRFHFLSSVSIIVI